MHPGRSRFSLQPRSSAQRPSRPTGLSPGSIWQNTRYRNLNLSPKARVFLLSSPEAEPKPKSPLVSPISSPCAEPRNTDNFPLIPKYQRGQRAYSHCHQSRKTPDQIGAGQPGCRVDQAWHSGSVGRCWSSAFCSFLACTAPERQWALGRTRSSVVPPGMRQTPVRGT